MQTKHLSRTSFFAIGCLATALAAAGCRVRDVRTATLRAEGLSDEKALVAAEAALRALPDSRLHNSGGPGGSERSFKILSHDFEKGEITVRYDAMKIGLKNMQWALAEAGFPNDAFDAASVADSKADR